MSSTRKSLSGATMGMRFMQRKTPTKASSAVENNGSSTSFSNSNSNSKEDDPMNGGEDAATRTPLTPQHQQSQRNQEGEVTNGNSNGNSDGNANVVELDPSIPTIATKADMYGMSAEIIGRRSFNGFNKAVENTYTKAVQTREEHRLGEKVERQQITDEELLERYEKYVKGNGDGDMTETKSKSVGNFKKKKRKRLQG
eukprot:249123_1